MGVVILIVLAAVWAAVLVPPMVRARREGRPAESIGDFRRQLQVLGRVTPSGRVVAIAPPSSVAARAALSGMRSNRASVSDPRAAARRRTLKRRRDILLGLAVVDAASLVLGSLPPLRVLWYVCAAGVLVTGLYVAILVRLRNVAAEREMKVRYLPTADLAQPEPVFAYRQTGN